MDAAEMALGGRDLAVQYRRDLVQLLVDHDVLLGMALQELEDGRVDHGRSAVVRHVCGKVSRRGTGGQDGQSEFLSGERKRSVAGK